MTLPIPIPAVSWSKLLLKALPYIGAILAAFALVWAVYSSGSRSGAAGVQAQWNVEKLENERALTKLRDEATRKETIHQQQSQRITDELANANQKHAASIAALNVDYAQRLSNSEQRAAHYQRMSTAGAVEQSNLASHAAKLDRALEEGRRLVQELSVTLEQRDAQLRALAGQLLTDRVLTGEKDGQSSPSAE